MSVYKTVEVKAKIANQAIDATTELTDKIIHVDGRTVTALTHQSASDYEPLINKPSIEGVTLVGNKKFTELGLRSLTNLEIETILQS